MLSVSSLIPIKSHVSASPASFWCGTVSLDEVDAEVEADSLSVLSLIASATLMW